MEQVEDGLEDADGYRKDLSDVGGRRSQGWHGDPTAGAALKRVWLTGIKRELQVVKDFLEMRKTWERKVVLSAWRHRKYRGKRWILVAGELEMPEWICRASWARLTGDLANLLRSRGVGPALKPPGDAFADGPRLPFPACGR